MLISVTLRSILKFVYRFDPAGGGHRTPPKQLLGLGINENKSPAPLTWCHCVATIIVSVRRDYFLSAFSAYTTSHLFYASVCFSRLVTYKPVSYVRGSFVQ